MSYSDLGTIVLRNSLIDFLDRDRPFTGVPCVEGGVWRYFFGKNTNHDQQQQILLRPNVKRQIAIEWSSARRQQAGNPPVTWLVSKVLSTTTLVITDWETHSVWWDMHLNGTDTAKALGILGAQNAVYVNWTLVDSAPPYQQASGQYQQTTPNI